MIQDTHWAIWRPYTNNEVDVDDEVMLYRASHLLHDLDWVDMNLRNFPWLVSC